MAPRSFYSYDEIRNAINCEGIAPLLEIEVKGGRCAATWRGGKNPSSVSIKDDTWYDHSAGEGGGVIELVARVKYGSIGESAKQDAQQWLGETLGLNPKEFVQKHKSGAAERLTEKGYRLVKEYEYRDTDGDIVHSVCRYEHPDLGKEFLQRTPTRWGVKGIKTLLYRLPEWTDKPSVCICEGEKDVDNLMRNGIAATTNPAGAAKWDDRYTAMLEGKNVVIVEDNDEAGKKRSKWLSWKLKDSVASIKLIRFPMLKKGGDVTDWMNADKMNTAKRFVEMIRIAKPIDLKQIRKPNEDYVALQEAKLANRKPFTNCNVFQAEGKTIRQPKKLTSLIEETYTRFMGFPCKVGEQLFDHDRETGAIEPLYKPSSVFAWIQRKSEHNATWIRSDGCVTKEEYFEGLMQAATRYEAISNVPDYPMRDDVYYAHPSMPEPTKDHAHFEKFMSFFRAATPEDDKMLRSFFAAPLFYMYGVDTPAWIIDSVHGAATGKTTLVDICAILYGGEPIKTTQQELKRNITEVIKRLLGINGRQGRIFLIDNVSGSFICPEYADLITTNSISGRASYGRGEETRPNNFTYVITANSANVDNDIAVRSFYVHVQRPKTNATWRTDLIRYVQACRYNILADMLDIIQNHTPFECGTSTRFPEFEERVMQAMCGSVGVYSDVMKMLGEARSESNIEQELAHTIRETIEAKLINLKCDLSDTFFIRSSVLDDWVTPVLPKGAPRGSYATRNLVKQGILTCLDIQTTTYPSHGKEKRRGMMYNRQSGNRIYVIGALRNGETGIVPAKSGLSHGVVPLPFEDANGKAVF